MEKLAPLEKRLSNIRLALRDTATLRYPVIYD
jgi:hypothetical protein